MYRLLASGALLSAAHFQERNMSGAHFFSSYYCLEPPQNAKSSYFFSSASFLRFKYNPYALLGAPFHAEKLWKKLLSVPMVVSANSSAAHIIFVSANGSAAHFSQVD